jgi:ABC-type glycerol-3-phosphate transport system permease component
MAESTLATRAVPKAADIPIARTVRPRRDRIFKIFVYIFLSVMAFIYVAPFVWMVGKSMMDKFEASTTAIIPTTFHTAENYCQVLGEPQFAKFCTAMGYPVDRGSNFLQYFVNTVKLEFLTIMGQLIFSILAAYAFARMKFPGRDILFGLFLLTIFVPETVLLVPNLVNVTYISRAFSQINPALKWIDNWPALVIPYLSNTFSIFLLRQFFKQIPDDLWDAAQIDGAGHLRFLFQIVVPLSRAAVFTTVVFTFIGTWNALQWPLLVISTNDQWRPIAVALQQYRASDVPADTQLLMAASVVTLAPVLLIYFIAQKQFTEGIATTGLKG